MFLFIDRTCFNCQTRWTERIVWHHMSKYVFWWNDWFMSRSQTEKQMKSSKTSLPIWFQSYRSLESSNKWGFHVMKLPFCAGMCMSYGRREKKEILHIKACEDGTMPVVKSTWSTFPSLWCVGSMAFAMTFWKGVVKEGTIVTFSISIRIVIWQVW